LSVSQPTTPLYSRRRKITDRLIGLHSSTDTDPLSMSVDKIPSATLQMASLRISQLDTYKRSLTRQKLVKSKSGSCLASKSPAANRFTSSQDLMSPPSELPSPVSVPQSDGEKEPILDVLCQFENQYHIKVHDLDSLKRRVRHSFELETCPICLCGGHGPALDGEISSRVYVFRCKRLACRHIAHENCVLSPFTVSLQRSTPPVLFVFYLGLSIQGEISRVFPQVPDGGVTFLFIFYT